MHGNVVEERKLIRIPDIVTIVVSSNSLKKFYHLFSLAILIYEVLHVN
jgi:hypothetical protein